MREMAMNTAAANDLVRISPNGTKVRTIPATVQRFAPAMPLRARLRVAAYARVSTDEEEQLSSYEAQVDYYTRYISPTQNGRSLRFMRMRAYLVRTPESAETLIA